MSKIHVHQPKSEILRKVTLCRSSACKRKRRHVMWTYDWYSPHITCCHCGFTRGLADHLRRKSKHRALYARQVWASL